jgi:hypothetical protein
MKQRKRKSRKEREKKRIVFKGWNGVTGKGRCATIVRRNKKFKRMKEVGYKRVPGD